MSRRTRVCSAIILAAFAASACGKDSAGPKEPSIAEAVSVQLGYTLVAEVMAVALNTIDNIILDGDPQPSTDTLSRTAQCVQGGTIEVEGTYTNDLSDQGAGPFTMSLQETPKNCGVPTSEGLFRVDGAPNLDVDVNIVVAGWDVADFKATYTGDFTWTGPTGSGTCTMNVTFDIDHKTLHGTKAKGKMCGYDVST